jgi:hypothetical protein
MRYTTSQSYEGMGEFLFRKWWDGEIEADDEARGEFWGFAQFGRRVIVDQEGTPVEYERFPTVTDACRRMEELHDERPPVYDWDAVISWDRGYNVSVEGVHVGTFDERDDAVIALAREMVRSGCFPDAFETNERGWYTRIDDEVREYHDAGGDKMRPDLADA